jgi:hypothetical protein
MTEPLCHGYKKGYHQNSNEKCMLGMEKCTKRERNRPPTNALGYSSIFLLFFLDFFSSLLLKIEEKEELFTNFYISLARL